MKKTGFLLIAVFLLIAGCTLMEKTSPNGGDFWLKMGDGTIVSASDIDYYDVSAHLIYLKKGLPYLKTGWNHGTMSVNVDHEEIYECTFHSVICSHIPSLYAYTSFFLDDIIQIIIHPFAYSNIEQEINDPRSDERIISALKNNGLYHEGLRCEVLSVNYSQGKLVLIIEISNPDSFDYYYLDPGKMGMGLFHYYTNGLSIMNDSRTQFFTHHETVIRPEPWNSWKKEWLSLIQSGESKNISITYQHFDNIPAGNYKMSFSFPGLNSLSQKEREYRNGRIWMGAIFVWKDITIN